MSTALGQQTRCAIYLRVSDTKQVDGYSLDTQEAGCRRLAEANRFSVDEAHIYREVHTGVELWERQQLTALRGAIRAGEIGAVVAYSIDRLARDPVHLGVVLSEADHAGVAVEFVTEPLDDPPEGQLIRFVRGYAAKVEHEKIKERTMRGRRARIDAGKLLPGSRPLYGYVWRDASKGAYAVDPSTAPTVQRIWREALAGASLRSIAARLTADGVPTPTGKLRRWGPSTVYNVLTQPAYTGEARALRRRYQKVRGKGYRVEWRPGEEQVVLPEGTVPALVTPAEFAAVQERLGRNRERAARNNRNPEATLLRGGYARCGYCGGVLVAAKAAHGHIYRCSTTSTDRHGCPHFSISAHVLDAAAWERVAGILRRPETIAAEVERLHRNDPTDAELAAVDRSLQAVGRQQGNLARRLALVDDEAATAVAEEINALATRKRRLEQERADLVTRQAGWQAAQERLESFEAWCGRVSATLESLTFEQRRLALDALGVQARVYRGDHDPRYVITASMPLDGPIASTSVSSSGPTGGTRSSRRRLRTGSGARFGGSAAVSRPSAAQAQGAIARTVVPRPHRPWGTTAESSARPRS